jgi:predicted Ser/Thr protein kinase
MEQVSSGKIGQYDIIKVLGRGGMGEVLLARDENLGRRVAIKRPFKSVVAEGLARFQLEAKAATLRHPNIPAVYEMGVHDDLPFIVMEFVEGESLEKVIDSKRDLDLITKLRIIEQVCSALGYAHENGVIHRDIKPANIIVQPDGVAKIIDFGIAKVQDKDSDAGLTKASQLIGSLHYIAPERFGGGVIDGRVDIFSAGVTLFKLLTGTEPFVGGEATASFKIMNEAHSPLSAYMHDYPSALDEIVTKALAKNPEDRYDTGEDFADALHEVIEDLKHTRVTELFNDAERLATERRFAPALELLDEAVKLDPANTQARKLRKFVREHQDRVRRAERLRDCLLRSDEALLSGNFEEALTQLRDAQNLDSDSAEIKGRIQSVEEKKRRFERSTKALAEAEITNSRGDINGAMRIITKALQEEPDNKKLLAASTVLTRQLETEAQRGKLLEILERATRALAARDHTSADTLLNEAAAIDASNPETDKLRRELAKARDVEGRRAALEQVQGRVHDFIRTEAFDQASALLNRALEKLPNETMLHRLKAEVDAEARKFEIRRFVEEAIRRAKSLFASSPFEALATLQKALEAMPGEERLIAYERSLRQELEAQRSESLRENTVLKARELMGSRQFDKAVDVLESYQLELGQHPDIDGLLSLARGELAARRRAQVVERSQSEARALVQEGRLDEAIGLLETATTQTGDATIAGLLHDLREQQASLARKLDAMEKRAELLRQRGELNEAIRLLQEQATAIHGNSALQQLLNTLLAEREQKQITDSALRAAGDAAQKRDFKAAIESLQAVTRAYGESPELAHAIHRVEEQRSSHAHEMVAKSIEAARSSLLKHDPQGALEALKGATVFLEFAGEQSQAEWQRIGQSVKKALQQSGATGSHDAFNQQLSDIAVARTRRVPVWAIAAAFVLLLAVAAVVILKLRTPPPAPPQPVESKIEIQNVPSGAAVSIDGSVEAVDTSGTVNLKVTAGKHTVRVSQSGFRTLEKTLEVDGTYSLDGSLIPEGVRTGTLSVVLPPDLPRVRVLVDGLPKGEFRNNDTIPLPVGPNHVRYVWDGYQESPDKVIDIADSTVSVDKVRLDKSPTAPTGKPSETTKSRAGAASSPAVGTSAAATTAAPAPVAPAAAPVGTLTLTATSIEPHQQVTLIWKVQNASSVEITGLGAVDRDGFRTVTPDKTTTYALIVDGVKLDEKTVQVNEAKAAEPAPQPPAQSRPAVSAPQQPTLPDTASLRKAIAASYESVFVRASGKKSSECKAAFSGVFGGSMSGFAQWCEYEKGFVTGEQCGQVGGTPDAPQLTCTEAVSVKTGDGRQDFPPAQKTFHFAKGPDGTWRVVSFQSAK